MGNVNKSTSQQCIGCLINLVLEAFKPPPPPVCVHSRLLLSHSVDRSLSSSANMRTAGCSEGDSVMDVGLLFCICKASSHQLMEVQLIREPLTRLIILYKEGLTFQTTVALLTPERRNDSSWMGHVKEKSERFNRGQWRWKAANIQPTIRAGSFTVSEPITLIMFLCQYFLICWWMIDQKRVRWHF